MEVVAEPAYLFRMTMEEVAEPAYRCSPVDSSSVMSSCTVRYITLVVQAGDRAYTGGWVVSHMGPWGRRTVQPFGQAGTDPPAFRARRTTSGL